jgi:hypothetical protein
MFFTDFLIKDVKNAHRVKVASLKQRQKRVNIYFVLKDHFSRQDLLLSLYQIPKERSRNFEISR